MDKLKILLIFLALMLACTLMSCGGKKADISAYGDTPITISGLENEEFTITPYELAKLDCVSHTASGKSAKAGTVDATGPLLDTFLAQYGKSAANFEKIRFIASDEYRITMKGSTLSEKEAIIAISNGSSPLEKAHQPARMMIPGADSSSWIYSVVRIEFVE